MSFPSTSIIIPVYNKVEYTSQCLRALQANTSGIRHEIIVVDNGSTDGTGDLLESLNEHVKVIRNETNLGFAKACNQGARAASGKYLIFLNNDTIPLPGWLDPLIQTLESDARIAVVGSKLIYPNDTIQHAGVVFSHLSKQPYHLYRCFDKHDPVVNKVREFPAVTAACMLVRKDIFMLVEMFDEAYVNAYEDADLCLKIGERGYKIVYNPNSVLYHFESVTEGRKAHGEYSKALLLKKWTNRIPLDEEKYYADDGMIIDYLNGEMITVVRRDRTNDLILLAQLRMNLGKTASAIELLEEIKRQAKSQESPCSTVNT